MSVEHTPKPRPYWHVDAKWIFSLALIFVLGVTLLIYGLVRITAEQPAVEALTMATALMYSPNGLDDKTEITEMRQLMALSPDGSIQPIPGLRISVSQAEIEGLTPREIRLLFFRKWAESIYPEGIDGLAALADDPELKSQIIEGGGLFNVLTLETHQSLKRGLVVGVVLSFFLLIPVVLFSYRFGRIGSPGCVLFFASLPGALFFALLATAIKPVPEPPVAEGGMTGMLGYLASNVLPSLAKNIAQGYLIFLAVGFGVMLLAGLGSIIWSLLRRNTQ
jgi:hypothetical protein